MDTSGYRGRFYNAQDLLDELYASLADRSTPKLIKRLCNYPLLIIDELGYQHRLFINQRAEQLTRHGIYRICKKYLSKTLSAKCLKYINPVHSFRHSRAVDLLYRGKAITDIKNRLGHDNIQSTTIYLHPDISRRRQTQNRFIKYMQSVITADSKIEQLLQWENKEDIVAWLDSL